MPRYFFNVVDGRDIPDNIGTELPHDAAAIAEARSAACESIRDIGPNFWDHDSWQMFVVDEAGRDVVTLSCLISSFGKGELN
jgi:hypothetical protein